MRNLFKLLLGTACCCVASGAMAADMALPPRLHLNSPLRLPRPGPASISAAISAAAGTHWRDSTPTGCCRRLHNGSNYSWRRAGGLQAGYNYQRRRNSARRRGSFSGSCTARKLDLAADGVNTLTTSADYFGTSPARSASRLARCCSTEKAARPGRTTPTQQRLSMPLESLTFTIELLANRMDGRRRWRIRLFAELVGQSRVRIHRHPEQAYDFHCFAGRVFYGGHAPANQSDHRRRQLPLLARQRAVTV